jgi:hypothetical protein
MYRPYSVEWHRRRYLKEAIDAYLDENIEADVIIGDIVGILNDRAKVAGYSLEKANNLLNLLNAQILNK